LAILIFFIAAGRQPAVALSRHPELSSAERETMHWLIQLADRVGEDDIEPRGWE
jgi:hypothetical protein